MSNAVLEVAPGDSYLRGARIQTVLGVDLTALDDSFRTTGTQGLATIPAGAFLRERAAAVALEDPRLQLRACDWDKWQLLSEEAKAKAIEKAEHVNEVLTGSRYGMRIEGEAVDERYDTSLPLMKRCATKAAELGNDPTTVFRWTQTYQEGGLYLLAHGNNKAMRDPLAEFSEAELDAARRFVAQLVKPRPSRHQNKTRAVFSAFLKDQGLEPRTSYWRQKLLDAVGQGQSLYGDATTRKSKAVRRYKSNQRRRDLWPGERIEIDGTPLNMALWSPDAKAPAIKRATVLGAVDCGSAQGYARLAIGRATARDACLLLYDVMCPSPLEVLSDDDLWSRFMGVPRELLIGPAMGLEIGAVACDHGKEFVNRSFIALLAQLRITLLMPAPRTPTFKAFVESLMRMINDPQQLLPGYLGNAVHHRGASEPPRHERLTHAEAEEALQNWVGKQYNNTPLERHGLVNHRHHALTPYQARMLDLAHGAPLRLPADPSLIYAFLPAEVVTPTSNGLHFGGLRYWGPVMNQLLGWAGDKRRPGRKIVVHYDHYDMSRVFWCAPDTATWHTLHALGHNNEVLPAFSEAFFAAFKKLDVKKRRSEQEVEVTYEALHRYGQALLVGGREERSKLEDDFLKVRMAVKDVTGDQVGGPPPIPSGPSIAEILDAPLPKLGPLNDQLYGKNPDLDLSQHFLDWR